MVSIRDEDVDLLRSGAKLLDTLEDNEAAMVASLIRTVLLHVTELMQPAPTIEPRIVPLTDDQMRIAYPQRYV